MKLPFPHLKNQLLSKYSTLGIGGPARFFAEARSAEEMQAMLAFAHASSLRVFILGKGSNTLFDDRGYDGLVIFNRIDYLHDNEGLFRAGSGYSFARLGGVSAKAGWSGLEFASGIPATVGGAICMNAGANGKETSESLVEVSFVTPQGELKRLARSELNFGYRTSPFQKGGGAIVEGVFQLTLAPSAKQTQKDLLSYRLKTQPYGEKSAGCAFRNPKQGSAGQVIEACQMKGAKWGGAAVSSLHANFIVNEGGAKAEDVLALMKKIQDLVYHEKGILLEEEIRYVPYDS